VANIMLILLIIEHLVEGGIATNIKVVIFPTLMMYGGLFQDQLLNVLCVSELMVPSHFNKGSYLELLF
jgi:hypothetical protein